MKLNALLVPVDFSGVTNAVYETAASLATRLNAAVVVLHVCEKEADYLKMMSPGAGSTPTNPGEKSLKTSINEAFEFFKQKGLTVDTAVRSGERVATILQEAEHHSAGMIIMASHGHGSLYSILVGSTTAGVLRHATVPVLIVPAAPPVKK